MKRILTSLVLVASVYSFAQVSISGENNHTPKATLDIEAIGADGTADGILIPRVDREKAQNMQHVKHSTLIYVDDITKGAQSGQANQIDAKGFYYFDTESNSGEWVKLGGSSSSSVEGGNIGYKFNSVDVVTPESFNGYDAVVFTSGKSNQLPDPSAYKGKSLVLINNSGANVTIDVKGGSEIVPGPAVKRTTSTIFASDGTTWYRMSN